MYLIPTRGHKSSASLANFISIPTHTLPLNFYPPAKLVFFPTPFPLVQQSIELGSAAMSM